MQFPSQSCISLFAWCCFSSGRNLPSIRTIYACLCMLGCELRQRLGVSLVQAVALELKHPLASLSAGRPEAFLVCEILVAFFDQFQSSRDTLTSKMSGSASR